MNIIKLYQDFSVDFRTEGQKHTRPGWVNCECPFCTGNPGLHLGWNIEEEYYFCWRCGWKPLIHTIAELINVSDNEAWNIARQYGEMPTVIMKKLPKDKKEFDFPHPCSSLSEKHRKYLLKRGFNPDEIESKWYVKGTGTFAKLDHYDYKFRIVIPYIWNGVPVSFDARDITGKAQNKYYACPKEYEIIEHKRILYGNQEKWNPDFGICVEGPTDVWRLGELSFAVSGIKYTNAQVRMIATVFKRVAVVFDNEPQAQVQAKKLVAELKFRGVNAFNVKIEGDPGSMTRKQAEELIQKIKNDV
jgi:hypothetical protein